MTRIRLSTLFAVVALVSVLLAFRFAVDRDEPYRRLAQLGAKIENHGEDGYCIELPDLIDPEIAIAAIEKIPDVRRIHFVSGESPPTGKVYLRTWEWDYKEARRRIKLFRDSFPDVKITFWHGAF
jgi:hypothetical protein